MCDCIKTKVNGSPREALKRIGGYEYSVGSHFWMLPDTAVDHIIRVYDNDKAFNELWHHVAAPEESYFQTALTTMGGCKVPDPWGQFASPEAAMDNPALRLIKWYEDGVHTNGHPAIWRVSDFDFIKNAQALFARKFEPDVDSAILDRIDQELLLKDEKV